MDPHDARPHHKLLPLAFSLCKVAYAITKNVNTNARARELTSGLITLADIHLTHFGSTASSCSTMRVRTLRAILSAPRCIIAHKYISNLCGACNLCFLNKLDLHLPH